MPFVHLVIKDEENSMIVLEEEHMECVRVLLTAGCRDFLSTVLKNDDFEEYQDEFSNIDAINSNLLDIFVLENPRNDILDELYSVCLNPKIGNAKKLIFYISKNRNETKEIIDSLKAIEDGNFTVFDLKK